MTNKKFEVLFGNKIIATCAAYSKREAIKICKAELVVIGRKDILAESFHSKINFIANEVFT